MFHTNLKSLLGTSILHNIPGYIDRIWMDALLAIAVVMLPTRPEGTVNLILYTIFVTMVLALVKDFVIACLTGDFSRQPYYARQKNNKQQQSMNKPVPTEMPSANASEFQESYY